MAEGEERFDGGEGSVARGGRQSRSRIGKVLEVGEGNLRKRLPCPGAEPFDVGAVGALGVSRAAVEPDFNELIVGGSAGRVRESLQRGGNGDFGAHGGEDSTNIR